LETEIARGAGRKISTGGGSQDEKILGKMLRVFGRFHVRTFVHNQKELSIQVFA
jgi:hypothetical protein